MHILCLAEKALDCGFLSHEEGLYLYQHATTAELMWLGHEIRKKLHPKDQVSWIIDRNVNITNVCICGCKFCNFSKSKNHPDAYLTSLDQYIEKIAEMNLLGGHQLLLQGGLHPDLGLAYYIDLFVTLKRHYPKLKLHALSPTEIVYLSKKEGLGVAQVLMELKQSGLDSLPGAGGEILVDEIRSQLSRLKCSSEEWLGVMHEAHRLNITTSATMMFGHIEQSADRVSHLIKIRQLQAQKPALATGFISFTCWPFQGAGTRLANQYKLVPVSQDEFIRTLSLSRILLPNINNVQTSWLTVGKDTAAVSLHAGANDMGSIMIEENVVSSAGINNKLNIEEMEALILNSGFTPQLRDQQYNVINKDSLYA